MLSAKCKVAFLGSSGVGKTSLVCRFIRNDFDNDYSQTVGIDFFTKSVQVRGQTVELRIWDTAGQERFRSLIPLYIRESSIAIIVYDVSAPVSFDEAKVWHKAARDERGNDVVCILVGNKTDLESRVNQEDVATFAQEYGIQTIGTCAKTGQNVHNLFRLITESVPEFTGGGGDPISRIRAGQTGSTQGSCFC
jgi:small GTP-binding protein